MTLRLKPHPYGCYALSFGIALITYLARWSELYPPLRSEVVAVILATSGVFLALGWYLTKRKEIIFVRLENNERAAVTMTVIVFVGWLAEFVYEGGIPLFKILLGVPYDYRLFGVPSFHVLMVTFGSYYTLYLFHVYLSSKSKLILLLYVLNLTAAILIYSRAMFFFNLTGSLFIFLSYSGGITLRQLVWAGAACIILFYIFGVLGSLRVSRIANRPYSNKNFMETGRATRFFRESIIPKEYFWGYIYVSSPLANLQQNINLDPGGTVTGKRLVAMINAEILPDFISKRTTPYFHLAIYVDSRIPGPFNVSTIYSRAYSYAGWPGILLMAFFLAVFPILFCWILPPSSRFFVSGWALLCTMYFFSVYDNTFRFTGLSFQLVYPILFHWIDKQTKILSRAF